MDTQIMIENNDIMTKAPYERPGGSHHRTSGKEDGHFQAEAESESGLHTMECECAVDSTYRSV